MRKESNWVEFFLLISIVTLTACGGAAKDASDRNFLIAPQSLSVSTDQGIVQLSWTEVNEKSGDPNAVSYSIYWNSTGNVTTLDQKLENVTSPYPVAGLTIGDTYYFIVTTVIAGSESEPSFEVFAIVPTPILVAIQIEPADSAMVQQSTLQLKSLGIYSDSAIVDFTSVVIWASENNNLVSVNTKLSKGLAGASFPETGITTITATDPISGLFGSTTLKVQIDHELNYTPPLGVCNNCHKRPNVHPNVSNLCEACHKSIEPFAWRPFEIVDHNEVFGNCIFCHDGVKYSGKPFGHIDSSNVCDACHSSFVWLPVATVDHGHVIGNCSNCHLKSTGHINTSAACDACHNTNNWKPVITVDHNQVIGICSSCHNGIVARGKGQNHFITTRECDICHITKQWPTVNFDHVGVSLYYSHFFGMDCLRCHQQNTETIIFPSLLNSCATCHEASFVQLPHLTATVVELENCSGNCHVSGPVHRPTDLTWLPPL